MALRRAFRGAAFFGLTLGYGTAVYGGVSRARGADAKIVARDRWSGGWSRALLRLFGVELVVSGDPDAGRTAGRGRMVVSNHRSIIDIAVLLSLFGGALVSRGDLEHWPILGPAARSAGTIFVDRSSKKSGALAITAMVARLVAGDTVCVFPEGTTYEDDEVRPFKPGASVAAARAGVPVLPVAIVYPRGSGAAFGGETFLRHLARLADTPTTRVLVEIGAPLMPEPDEALESFNARCRQEVAKLFTGGRARET